MPIRNNLHDRKGGLRLGAIRLKLYRCFGGGGMQELILALSKRELWALLVVLEATRDGQPLTPTPQQPLRRAPGRQ
jgi:hypothetical protein